MTILLKLEWVAWNNSFWRGNKKLILHNTLALKIITFDLLVSARWIREILLHTSEVMYFKNVKNTINLCQISCPNPRIYFCSIGLWTRKKITLPTPALRFSPIEKWLNPSFKWYLQHLCVHLLQLLSFRQRSSPHSNPLVFKLENIFGNLRWQIVFTNGANYIGHFLILLIRSGIHSNTISINRLFSLMLFEASSVSLCATMAFPFCFFVRLFSQRK